MASKRKSTVPCMIPSKSKHMREEIILGCLPELLPTIPEDSILSISGEDGCHFSHDFTRPEVGDRWQKADVYSCQPCRFESKDLNYFLDHLHNCHMDFRAQPSFYCLNCGVSVVRFEALALHNAKAHPGVSGGSVTASLHVRRRDGTTTVEQSLFTTNGEDFSDPAISLTKTPIVRMMKAKGEHKKIVVSHTVEVRQIAPGKATERTDPAASTNVPEIHNGSLSGTGGPATLRNPVTHVMTTSTVPNQAIHQHSPPLYSSSSTNSSKNLPKVMIPLSSIPTYDAAMDTSSFLKTSFGKFPYPTKAELCYLTVVSDWPEEQIKLWFTAQRLKQGISWSPEEIEEARRKMFNTVFQGAVPPKQPPKQRHTNHVVTHHTVHGQPAPAGASSQTARLPHGTVVSRHTGVIATSTSMSTAGHPVTTRVSYAAAAMTPPKYQTIVSRTAQVVARNTIPTTATSVESDKGTTLRLGLAGNSSCVVSTSSRSSSSSSSCSSSSISSYSSISSNGRDSGSGKPISNISSSDSMLCCPSNSGNNDDCSTDSHDKPNSQSSLNTTMPSLSEGFSSVGSNKRKVIMSNTSTSNVTALNSRSNGKTDNQDEYPCRKSGNDRNNNNIHKSNNGSISSGYSSASNNHSDNNNLTHASKSQKENTSTSVITKSSCSSSISTAIKEDGKCTKEFPVKSMSVLRQLIKEGDNFGDDLTCPELKVDPIKINLRRLMVSDPKTNSGSDAFHPELPSDIHISDPSHPPFSATCGKKSSQQVYLLRQAFTSTHWPSSQQYEELSVITGLPKPEVVRWFSDSRYFHKNGQLKWLEGYHCLPAEGEEGKDLDTEALILPKDVHRDPDTDVLIHPQEIHRDPDTDVLIHPQEIHRDPDTDVLIHPQEIHRDPDTDALIHPQEIHRDPDTDVLIHPQEIHRDPDTDALIHPQEIHRDSDTDVLIHPQEIHRDPDTDALIHPQEIHRDPDTDALIHPQEVHRKLVEQKINRELKNGPDRLSLGKQGFWWTSDTQRMLVSAKGPEEAGETQEAVGTENTEGVRGPRADREKDQQPVSSQAFGDQQAERSREDRAS
ncbi:zinc fingers and homeoboxes protein 3 isoform X2 [Esox lucius]|uniref:zinc fingers and homeoboxes protein 3 isoform X2 n=1 Tax=Esox lucius TaxID=8010 RepID=UPI001476FF0B|nr:zinc fingers and homeoboxes protein 3 isoform X2 [Esox lucius]